MFSKLESFAVTTLVVIVLAMTTSTMSLPTENGGSIYNVVYLGAVDGKSYFYEKTTRNWSDADQMCTASGMRLATITSQEQAAFLSNSSDALGISYYWVAAQESQTLSRYTWKHDGESVKDSPVPLSPTDIPPVVDCLTYRSNQGQYFIRPCSADNTFTLCEIASP